MNWLIKWEDVSASMASDERKLSISKRVKGVKKKSLLNHFTLEKNDETISLGSTDLINVDSKAVVYKVHKTNYSIQYKRFLTQFLTVISRETGVISKRLTRVKLKSLGYYY